MKKKGKTASLPPVVLMERIESHSPASKLPCLHFTIYISLPGKMSWKEREGMFHHRFVQFKAQRKHLHSGKYSKGSTTRYIQFLAINTVHCPFPMQNLTLDTIILYNNISSEYIMRRKRLDDLVSKHGPKLKIC